MSIIKIQYIICQKCKPKCGNVDSITDNITDNITNNIRVTLNSNSINTTGIYNNFDELCNPQ